MFNSKKLKAISKPPKITIIKLNPKIQFRFRIRALNRNIKKIKIIENSIIKEVVIRFAVKLLNPRSTNTNSDVNNFNQKTIYIIKTVLTLLVSTNFFK